MNNDLSISFKPDSNFEKNNNEFIQDKEIFQSTNKINFDNKAFEIDTQDINDNKMDFQRENRPGSMMSIKSCFSKGSRTSINCINGRIKCPNIRLNKFFSYKSDTGFIKASDDIRKLIIVEKDGTFIGNWLLIEISYWDLHREKIILLTEKSLFIITYDFIKSKIYDYKKIELIDLKKVNYGNLKYPSSSIMGDYAYGAVKINWGEENLSFFDKWNPFNYNTIPFIILTSHHILYNEKEKETEIYNCDEFILSLESALKKLKMDKTKIIEETIQIQSYASLLSVMYNHNWLGFQLDRNGINY